MSKLHCFASSKNVYSMSIGIRIAPPPPLLYARKMTTFAWRFATKELACIIPTMVQVWAWACSAFARESVSWTENYKLSPAMGRGPSLLPLFPDGLGKKPLKHFLRWALAPLSGSCPRRQESIARTCWHLPPSRLSDLYRITLIVRYPAFR